MIPVKMPFIINDIQGIKGVIFRGRNIRQCLIEQIIIKSILQIIGVQISHHRNSGAVITAQIHTGTDITGHRQLIHGFLPGIHTITGQ